MGTNDRKAKITVIDDNKDLVQTIKSFLEERGFLVSAAYDGRNGVEVVKSEHPDIIILDIMMPDMDGIQVLAELKKDDTTKDIPVIVLTGKESQDDRDYGLKFGAYEYITKPYDSYMLLRNITRVLEKKKLREL